jgi:hypothetical protein
MVHMLHFDGKLIEIIKERFGNGFKPTQFCNAFFADKNG